jgi:hypothetical protein
LIIFRMKWLRKIFSFVLLNSILNKAGDLRKEKSGVTFFG